MKKFLEVYVGSRGLIEGVEERKFENIEEWLEGESKKNMGGLDDEEWDDDEDREEVEGYFDWGKDLNDDYYLGLGDEEVKVYVDMECERFIKWKNEYGIGEDVDWNKIEDKIIKELV